MGMHNTAKGQNYDIPERSTLTAGNRKTCIEQINLHVKLLRLKKDHIQNWKT